MGDQFSKWTGTELAGVLPAQARKFNSYAAGILTNNNQIQAAKALSSFISSPTSLAVMKSKGFVRLDLGFGEAPCGHCRRCNSARWQDHAFAIKPTMSIKVPMAEPIAFYSGRGDVLARDGASAMTAIRERLPELS